MTLNTIEPTPRKRRRWKRYVALALTLLIVILWWRVWQGGVSIGPKSTGACRETHRLR